MGSGSFPLSRTDRTGVKLLEAAKLINAAVDEIADSVYSGESGGMQYDNAASDGGSLALLYLAARLVLAEVEKEPARG